MMPDETPPEFDEFESLTRKLLNVSKDDLDRARAGHTEHLPDDNDPDLIDGMERLKELRAAKNGIET